MPRINEHKTETILREIQRRWNDGYNSSYVWHELALLLRSTIPIQTIADIFNLYTNHEYEQVRQMARAECNACADGNKMFRKGYNQGFKEGAEEKDGIPDLTDHSEGGR